MIANNIFIKKLGYNPIFFSYPFGEYSNLFKNHITKNFKFAFGQHSGVIDINKDQFELTSDFQLMKNMVILKRFKFLINLISLTI